VIPMLVNQLVARAMHFSISASDDAAGILELHRLADGDNQALERAIQVCLAQPASLAMRHHAIELLARVRYEDPPAPHDRP
jgi:hypothetical protein